MTMVARHSVERTAAGSGEPKPSGAGVAPVPFCEVELIEDRAAIPLTGAEWNALAVGNETSSVFQTYEWFDAWWRCFGDRGQLYFVLVRVQGRPVGFAALMIRRTTVGLRQLEFVGHGSADYQDFVLPFAKRETLAAVCRFLRSDAGRWDRMLLSNVPEHSLTYGMLKDAARSCELHVMEEARVLCPTMLLEDRAVAARHLLDKYSMRRPLNWFSRRGQVTFRRIEQHELGSMLPRYFDQHVRRCQAKGMRSLFVEVSHRRFYEELANGFQPTGWLLFSVVELDGEPIAFHFGFDYGGSVIWYKPSFEINLASRSPGLLLIRHIIEDALARDRREVDFTVGDEPFKVRFANAERANLYIAVYHSRLLYVMGTAYKLARRSLSNVLRLGSRRPWKPTSRLAS